ncbi:GyrI-like domain-containing protein [Catellatospora tritici]|uniref:GyrI-like domain-containing protein n=1 Tax=Catellatospora tritici TaxID=2851566 RepID=UPI001C2DEFE4|nr:GyrI-like domain-containing protein [Catellatospora tritici]MBV1850796.1 GyrI-like domain-containing protein [Catellatospora tritici]MBV1851049.1 GyrI-like domain-containing protein [Catellatospora tritici]
MTSTPPVHPAITDRAAQPYAGIKRTVTMNTIPEIADRIPQLIGWLAARGIAPAGAPFLKYNVIDMDRELQMEAGVPVAEQITGDGDVFGAVLPAGRYVTVTHRGHPSELEGVTGAVLAWAEQQGLRWDTTATPDGERWTARLELYHTNPMEQPDMSQWQTELAFRLAD